MARITVEDCLQHENNRFALVLLASHRTKQLLMGASPTNDDARDNKSVVTALREIADGNVRFMTEEDLEELRKKEEEERAEAEVISDIDRAAASLFHAPQEGAADDEGAGDEGASSQGGADSEGDAG